MKKEIKNDVYISFCDKDDNISSLVIKLENEYTIRESLGLDNQQQHLFIDNSLVFLCFMSKMFLNDAKCTYQLNLAIKLNKKTFVLVKESENIIYENSHTLKLSFKTESDYLNQVKHQIALNLKYFYFFIFSFLFLLMDFFS